MPNLTNVLLSSTDQDFGLEPTSTAEHRAAQLANLHKTTVYLRDPVTDKVIKRVKQTP